MPHWIRIRPPASALSPAEPWGSSLAGLKSVPVGGIHAKTLHQKAAETWAEKERQAQDMVEDKNNLTRGEKLYIKGLQRARSKAEALDGKTKDLEKGWGSVTISAKSAKLAQNRFELEKKTESFKNYGELLYEEFKSKARPPKPQPHA